MSFQIISPVEKDMLDTAKSDLRNGKYIDSELISPDLPEPIVPPVIPNPSTPIVVLKELPYYRCRGKTGFNKIRWRKIRSAYVPAITICHNVH